jgi:hypothetical protein
VFILPVLYLRGYTGIISPLSPFREEMPKSSTRFTLISLSVIPQSYFRFNDVPYARTEYLYIRGLYLVKGRKEESKGFQITTPVLLRC